LQKVDTLKQEVNGLKNEAIGLKLDLKELKTENHREHQQITQAVKELDTEVLSRWQKMSIS
jgi:hypothetical protein